MKSSIILTMLLFTHINTVVANSEAVNSIMQTYIAQGATLADAQKGKLLWNKKFPAKSPFSERSCASCHTSKLSNTGKHIRTTKDIPALAPSVNNQSLTKVKRMRKWLKRNCKWTLGRECTIQEKADLITYISQQ